MSSPSRVLLVLHRADRAGTERHALWLARGLKRRGWAVFVAVSHDGPIASSFRTEGIATHLLARGRGYDPLYAWRVGSLAQRLNVDVIHTHSGRWAALAGRLARVPVVIDTRHGLGEIGEPPGGGRLRREALFCRIAHRTVTVSEMDRRRLVQAGLRQDRVICIPNGIPAGGMAGAARERPVIADSDGIRLGFLGRLSPEKGPLFLVDVIRTLAGRTARPWELCIAGEGPLRHALEAGLAPYHRSGSITWLGQTEGPAALLRRTDILLVPSLREGQPLGVLEAMAAGVVVIAREIPSLAELLGGEPPAGLLLPPDPVLWVEKILSLSGPPGDLRALREEGGRRVASRHSLERMVDAIETLYRETFAVRAGD
jgi:glycosyltransferase involved in cell wall biosynthesis